MAALGTISVFLMVLSCLAVSAATPAYYLLGIQNVPIWGRMYPLAKISIYSAAAYVGTNYASAKWRPAGTWGIDLISSVIAAVSINYTAIQFFGENPFRNFDEFLQMPIDRHVLVFITIYSWIDITWNQRRNWWEVAAAMSLAAPPPPHPTAAPVPAGGRARWLAILMGVVVAGVFVLLSSGVDFSKIRLQLKQSEPTECVAKMKFVGYDADGKKLYVCD